ncbi:MAG: sulfotransferase [Planctomycetota bacterium]
MKPVKVVGVGLNKTGTKTLGRYLERWGYRNRSYDSDSTRESPSYRMYADGRIDALLDEMEGYDSFEDWPWPLLYREIDARFPDARFVLTVRESSDVWFRSLCNMAVRLGPLPLFERHVYGSSMPQGRRAEHIAAYEEHNRSVRDFFQSRPQKLLEVCWEAGDDAVALARFLELDDVDTSPLHVNRSPGGVYDGDSRLLAIANHWKLRALTGPKAPGRRFAEAIRSRVRPDR